MPKVKVPRKSTAIDMTAMCDVAFLLLTFFILTTKFRPQEAVQIDIPPSTSQIPIPDKDIMMFNIAPDGRIIWGMDIRELPAFLDKEPNERAAIQQPGLKIDTTGGETQVEDLILFSRRANNNLRIAIKGDKTTEYKSFDKLIQALQNRKVNKFNIITSARSKQE